MFREREEAGKRRGNRERERGVRVYGWKNNCEEMNGKLVLTSKWWDPLNGRDGR